MKYTAIILFFPLALFANIIHTGFPENHRVQQYVNYAYEVSSGDMDFVLTLQAENGDRDPSRKSKTEPSYGFCQFNTRWHRRIVEDPRFKDPFWQLDKCRWYYSHGTKFYGYNNRLLYSHLFTHAKEKPNSTGDNGIFDNSIIAHIRYSLDYFIGKDRRTEVFKLEVYRNKGKTGDCE